MGLHNKHPLDITGVAVTHIACLCGGLRLQIGYSVPVPLLHSSHNRCGANVSRPVFCCCFFGSLCVCVCCLFAFSNELLFPVSCPVQDKGFLNKVAAFHWLASTRLRCTFGKFQQRTDHPGFQGNCFFASSLRVHHYAFNVVSQIILVPLAHAHTLRSLNQIKPVLQLSLAPPNRLA